MTSYDGNNKPDEPKDWWILLEKHWGNWIPTACVCGGYGREHDLHEAMIDRGKRPMVDFAWAPHWKNDGEDWELHGSPVD